jgi:hypothetical protein
MLNVVPNMKQLSKGCFNSSNPRASYTLRADTLPKNRVLVVLHARGRFLVSRWGPLWGYTLRVGYAHPLCIFKVRMGS